MAAMTSHANHQFVPAADEKEAPTAAKNAETFAELVQCLDDRSLALVIREAKDDGRWPTSLARTLSREGQAAHHCAVHGTHLARDERRGVYDRLPPAS